MATERYTAAQMIEALRLTKGMVYIAAERLGCSYQTVYNYCERYPSVKAELSNQDGIIDDTAELKLIQAIYSGEAWAVKYRLSTKGRNRGYVERQEITGKDGEPMKYQLEYVNDWRGVQDENG